ncbi:DUF3859 domain-containing protein [Pseudooctadecabacter sp.]|uniref:DUF3859 domain-containing protein n=1 Tax=Pseudooctadecabacter sp. TaxID=1966338 RepID=UPI0035C85F5E
MTAVLALGWGGCVLAQEGEFVSPMIGFFEAGVVCAPEATGERDALGTVAGTTHVINQAPPFVSNGRIVPAVLGVGFGVRSGLGFAAQDTVLMTVTHPPFQGSGATTQSFVTSIGSTDRPGITFYQFDETYELALGDWTMTATTGVATLYEVTFTVVDPALVPDLANACGYLDLLS